MPRPLRILVQLLIGIISCLAILTGIASLLAVRNLSQSPDTRGGVVFIAIGLGLGWLAVRLSPAPERKSAALTIGCFGLGSSSLMVIILPVFFSAKASAVNSQCMSSIKELGKGMLIYASDFDDRLPPSAHWRTLLGNQGGSSLLCPLAETPWSYAMNSALSGASLAEISDLKTVMVFEADAQTPDASGGKSIFSRRHRGTGYVYLIDNIVRRIVPDNEAEFRWKP